MAITLAIFWLVSTSNDQIESDLPFETIVKISDTFRRSTKTTVQPPSITLKTEKVKIISQSNRQLSIFRFQTEILMVMTSCTHTNMS